MNRIQDCFYKLKRENKKAFIAYITAGYPDIKSTYNLIKELDRCGVDILELGMPFSDPIADGPVIQLASFEALKKGINMEAIFSLARRVRKTSDLPIALMTYYNPVFVYGIESFVRNAKTSGIDGVIIPDLPPEEAEELISSSKNYNFMSIFLLSPTSTRKRIRLVSKYSTGFIYYVSLTGVTGVRKHLPSNIADHVRVIKSVTEKPVCVGFGVSTPKQAKMITQISDGIIVGSAIIRIIQKNLDRDNMPKVVGRFVNTLIKATKT